VRLEAVIRPCGNEYKVKLSQPHNRTDIAAGIISCSSSSLGIHTGRARASACAVMVHGTRSRESP
jgi:hypothetical protein